MRLVEVDRRDLQASQAFFDRPQNVGAAEPLAVGPVPHRHGHLRRDDQLVAIAPLLQPAADDAFRDASRIADGPAAVDVAVSMKLPPAATKASITSNAAASSVVQPNCIDPRQRRETSRSVTPNLRRSIASFYQIEEAAHGVWEVFF